MSSEAHDQLGLNPFNTGSTLLCDCLLTTWLDLATDQGAVYHRHTTQI